MLKKSEFVAAVQARANVDVRKADVEAVCGAVFDVIKNELGKGEKFTYPEFGTFDVRHRNARTGRNPQTGAPTEVAASNTVGFKLSPALKQ
ncbi:MAG: HU family DNA-binding protein, partial [Chloroflexi bacterium]|nr:HU family DNA-binding protein [Chloroflexota bacterium]